MFKAGNGQTPTARLSLVPFEGAIAFLVMVQGTMGLLGVGPTLDIVPPWARTLLLILYMVGGLGILIGILFARGDVEAAGLIFLASALAARSYLIALDFGWSLNGVVTVTFGVVFVAACVTRFRNLVVGGRELVFRDQTEEGG
jgi:hypothetical protein